jgi:hypothetical protein
MSVQVGEAAIGCDAKAISTLCCHAKSATYDNPKLIPPVRAFFFRSNP